MVQALNEVNTHLAKEVEKSQSENESLRLHVRRLNKMMQIEVEKNETRKTQVDNMEGMDSTQVESSRLPEEEARKGHAQMGAVGLTQGPVGDTKDSESINAEEREFVCHACEKLKKRAMTEGWCIESSQIKLGALLGQGTFGKTLKGTWRGVICAVKQVKMKKDSTEAFCRELQTLSAVRHPHVLCLYGGVFEPPEKCWIVTEYVENGSLNEMIHGRNDPLSKKPYAMRLQVLADVAAGMEALEQHDPPILHRDLKPSNILIDQNYRAKVSDMGLSRILTEDALVSLTPETGSYLYMAPEVISHSAYATQADVWSWACTAVEILSLERPYTKKYLTPIQIALAVGDGGLRPDIPQDVPDQLADLLRACFNLDPLTRPSFAVIATTMRNLVENEEQSRRKMVNLSQWFTR